MKKLCTKILICALIALCAISTMAIYAPVNASTGISTYSYYEPTFSFKGTVNVAYFFEGSFLTVTVKATASNNNNETITMKVYIEKTGKTKSYTFLSDGKEHSYKNIFLGFPGGSNVRFTFTGANPEITITTTLKAVS